MKQYRFSLRKTKQGLLSLALFSFVTAMGVVTDVQATSDTAVSWVARTVEVIQQDIQKAIDAKEENYKVQYGDTLSNITEALNNIYRPTVSFTWKEVAKQNNIENPNMLPVGTKIKLTIYTVNGPKVVQMVVTAPVETSTEMSCPNVTKVAVETTKQELTKPTLTTKEDTKVDVVEPTKTPLTEVSLVEETKPKVETPAVNESTTEETKPVDVVEQPKADTPTMNTPATEESKATDVVDQPEMETPKVDAPKTEENETVDVVDQPEVDAPTVDTPTTEETENPTVETPETDTPNSNRTRGQRFNAGEILDLNKTYDLFFNMVNNARTAIGIHPLERSTLLQKGTDTRSKELADVNNITPPNQKPHARPDGSDYSTAFKYTGLSFTSGEALTGKHYFNKTLNQMEDPETVASYFFEKWKNSPAHYELLLDEDFYSGSLSLQANENGTDDHTFVVATYVGSGLTDAGFEKINTILDKYNYREFIDKNELGFDHETEISETLEEDYKSHAIELGLYTEPTNSNANAEVESNN